MRDVLADHRRREILVRIRRAGVVKVSELAAELSVAGETVRRDLKRLDEQGVLIRTHGGAVALESPTDTSPAFAIDVPFDERRRAMLAQKRAIAHAAFAQIHGPAVVALDGSTTAWELASLLTDPELTVVTNSLIVTTLLASKPGPKVISVGGSLDKSLLIFTGMIALDGLRHMHIDLFFCSCGGIDPARGFSDPSEAGAHFKRQLIALADRTVLLADSTKFSSRAPVVFASPSDVGELITDTAADAASLQRLEDAGLLCTRVRTD